MPPAGAFGGTNAKLSKTPFTTGPSPAPREAETDDDDPADEDRTADECGAVDADEGRTDADDNGCVDEGCDGAAGALPRCVEEGCDGAAGALLRRLALNLSTSGRLPAGISWNACHVSTEP